MDLLPEHPFCEAVGLRQAVGVAVCDAVTMRAYSANDALAYLAAAKRHAPDDGQAADAFPVYLAIFKRPDPTVTACEALERRGRDE